MSACRHREISSLRGRRFHKSTQRERNCEQMRKIRSTRRRSSAFSLSPTPGALLRSPSCLLARLLDLSVWKRKENGCYAGSIRVIVTNMTASVQAEPHTPSTFFNTNPFHSTRGFVFVWTENILKTNLSEIDEVAILRHVIFKHRSRHNNR